MKKLLVRLIAVTSILGGGVLAPVVAHGQSTKDLQHRQQKKNEWRNIAYGAGAVGLFGLLKHDNTLFFAGSAGALYSAYRYEQDRKSQSRMQRARASYFSRSHFTRSGVRYDRKVVYKNGKKYYRFVRHSA